jgi:hypothetical protein
MINNIIQDQIVVIGKVDLMKDDKWLVEMAKEGDVHVELIGANMLTQRVVLLKELNLLKRKSELMGVRDKLIVNIDKPITSEKDEMGLTPDKEESTCLKRGLMAKRSVLPQKIIVEYMEKKNGELLEFMMNSKMEVKLGQLLKICLHLREMMTKSLLKIEEAQNVNVCKVITTKIEDFDEAILIIQIRAGKFGTKDALLDDGSNVNIIFENLWKKLGLKKPKPPPFVVRMVV